MADLSQNDLDLYCLKRFTAGPPYIVLCGVGEGPDATPFADRDEAYEFARTDGGRVYFHDGQGWRKCLVQGVIGVVDPNWLDELDALQAWWDTAENPEEDPIKTTRLVDLKEDHARELIDAAMATRGFDAVQRLAPTSVATGIPITDLAAAFRTAKDLPEVPAAELLVWKRVEDGLPEPGEVVLVAYDDWSGRNIEQARAVKHGFCKPTNDYDVGVDDVTHWAPMPKGPTP